MPDAFTIAIPPPHRYPEPSATFPSRRATRDARLRGLAVAPYGIIDSTPFAGNAIGGGTSDGFG